MKALLARVFATGILVLGCGVIAVKMIGGPVGFSLLRDALTLGGGLLICGFFALRSYWHGIIGAGVLALLAAGRGVTNLPGAVAYFSGDRTRGMAPLLELAVTVATLGLLVRVTRTLLRERVRRLEEQRRMEEEEA